MNKTWSEIGAAPAGAMAQAHFQPHQLAQWLARFARGYLEPRADDSHTSLTWRRDLKMMITGEAAVGGRRVALGLFPRDLTLAVLSDGAVVEEAAMTGRRNEEAGDWVRARLRECGLDPGALDASLPYELPPSPYGAGALYDAQKTAAGLAELNSYFDNADLLLSELIARYRDIRPGPSPVRLWPHHFDIAISIALEEGDFESSRSIGAGLAVPDTLCTEFYWYVYPWPDKAFKALADPGPAGKYALEGFSGAALPMSKVAAADDQEAAARMFIGDMTDFFLTLLRNA